MFYDNYVKLCASIGKAPSAVAEEIGLYKSTVSNWKNRGTNPTDATAQRIAAYFGISVAELTAEEQTKKPATVSGDELDPVTRDIMDILSDLTPEELALAKARLLKIKESR
jgi:transcriptional regulator with XRE-family HTH domain